MITIMKSISRIFFAVALGLFSIASSANAAGKLYRCTELVAYAFDDNGLLTEPIWKKKSQEPLQFLIDTSSGIMRSRGSTGTRWETQFHIDQEGSDEYYFIATPMYELEKKLTSIADIGTMNSAEVMAYVRDLVDYVAKSAAFQSIFVKDWGHGSTITFRWFRPTDFISGTCKEIP